MEPLETRALLSTWPVTSLADSGEDTLRWAIDQANANAGDDTIDIQVAGTITLLSPLANLSDTNGATEILGPGTDSLTVARGEEASEFRMFTIEPGVDVTIDRLNITGGVSDYGGSFDNAGIDNAGTLTIDSCVISGIWASSFWGGGGIVNRGTMTITACTISDWGGGGISNYGTIWIAASTLSGNWAGWSGGGIYNDGTMTVVASTISGNSARTNGGGIFNRGTMSIDASTIGGNRAFGMGEVGGDGGGICNWGTMTLVASTIGGNTLEGVGGAGGICNWGTMSIDASTISGNSAYWSGGGISNGGTMSIDASIISGNSAYLSGGGISNGGTMSIDASTISGNSADESGGGISNGGTMSIDASTISGNSAYWSGGGIHNGGTMSVVASTISGNWAEWYGGGIQNWPTATLTNTIVADSSSGGDIEGTVAGRFNLISDGSGGLDSATNLLGVDPMLGPLQDNGGQTLTIALLPGSPAIDTGIPVEGINTDQRGLSRTISGAPDIGAFEFATLSLNPIVVNGVEPQRSNVTTVALPFNQWTNLPALIADGSVASAVRLFAVRPSGEEEVPLEVARYQYDRDSFTLTIDLRLTDSQKTMLADGRYELRVGTGLVHALGNPTNPLADGDGTADGRMTADIHRLEGDFNGDARVDMGDRVDFLGHFGSKLGQSLYDYAFDLNGDGLINILDYNLWLKKRGKSI